MSYSHQLTTNTLWNALERFSTMGIQLVCTFILARFLTPADFGLVGMLVVFTLIGNTITESGFSQALIREEHCSNRMLSTVFFTNLLLSFLVYCLLFAASPLIAAWYHQPELVTVARFTFLVIPLNAVSLIHFTLCTRRLQFRPMCLVSMSASVISCLVAILWAWQHHSYWALVLQNVLAYTLRTLGYWVICRWHPSWQFSIPDLRRLFAFSRNLLITGLIGNLFNNIYSLLIGRYYGATQAGYFVQADRIRQVTSASSTQVVQSVSYPILSQIHHHDDTRLLQAYRRIILTTLMLVGLGMTLLMCISHDLMQLLMGSRQWVVAGQYLYALGVAGILFPLHAVNQNILLVKGLGRTVLWLEVARRSLMLLLLAIALQFSVHIFVWSYAVYSILLIFLNLWVCGRPIGYHLCQQLRDIAPVLSRLFIVLLVALMVNHYLWALSTLCRMLLTLTIVTLLALSLFWRLPLFQDALNLLRSLKQR